MSSKNPLLDLNESNMFFFTRSTSFENAHIYTYPGIKGVKTYQSFVIENLSSVPHVDTGEHSRCDIETDS